MIIRHINSFFHRNSRWLFGIFTLLIAIAFMDFMNPARTGGCSFGAPEVGTAFGRKISYNDIADARSHFMLYAQMRYGFNVREPQIENLFGMVVRLEAAKTRGIAASDIEIANAIRTMPRFQKNGAFDLALFQEFLASAEKQGFSRAEVDSAVGNGLILEKLGAELTGGIIVTDAELATFHRVMNEKFTVRTREFKSADYMPKGAPDAAKLAEFFAARKANYRVPAKAKAVIAVFPFSDPAAVKAAQDAATSEALQRFYESNSALFMKTVKGKEKEPGKEILPPFHEVEKSVREKFLAATALKYATDAAQNFSRSVYNDNEEDIVATFKAVAAKKNVKLAATGVLSAADTKIGGLDSPELIRAIFKHIDTVPVTDAVVGDKAAYVAVAFDIQKERQALQEEVKAELEKDFAASEAVAAARAAASAMRDKMMLLKPEELKKAIDADKAFKSLPAFTMMTPPQDIAGYTAAPVAEMTLAGKISQPSNLPEGALLVYVESRVAPATPKEFEAGLRERYRMVKARGVISQFQEYCNSNASFSLKK